METRRRGRACVEQAIAERIGYPRGELANLLDEQRAAGHVVLERGEWRFVRSASLPTYSPRCSSYTPSSPSAKRTGAGNAIRAPTAERGRATFARRAERAHRAHGFRLFALSSQRMEAGLALGCPAESSR